MHSFPLSHQHATRNRSVLNVDHSDIFAQSDNMVRFDCQAPNYDVRSSTFCPMEQCAAYRRNDIWASDLHAGDYYMEGGNGYQRTHTSVGGMMHNSCTRNSKNGGGFNADSEPDAAMSDGSSPRDQQQGMMCAGWEQSGANHTSGSMQDSIPANGSKQANFGAGKSSASTASSDNGENQQFGANNKLNFGTNSNPAQSSIFGTNPQQTSIFGTSNPQQTSIFGTNTGSCVAFGTGGIFGGNAGTTNNVSSAPAFGVQKRQNAPDTIFAHKRMKF
jgi:hypothetical protein